MVDSLRKANKSTPNSNLEINSRRKKIFSFQKKTKEQPFNYNPVQRKTLAIDRKSRPTIIQRWIKRFFYFVLFLVLAFMLSASLFLFRFSHSTKKIVIRNDTSFSESKSFLSTTRLVFNLINLRKKSFYDLKLKGKNRGQINILLLGIAGKGKAGTNLTDTIMIMSLNLNNKKIALLSLPRDFYYIDPVTKKGNKINALYQLGLRQHEGVELTQKAIENVTGLPIDYYIVLDFDGFKKIIDEIGGIDIYSKRDYYDSHYPGPNYSYETFVLKKGWHHFNGEIALKYARERHSDPEGDFGRAKRQQQVIKAVRDKFFKQKSWLNIFTLNKILGTVENNLKTNIDLNDLDDFIFLAYHLNTKNIINKVIDAWKPKSLLKVDHIEMGGVRAFVLVPKKGYSDYSDIRELAKNLFN